LAIRAAATAAARCAESKEAQIRNYLVTNISKVSILFMRSFSWVLNEQETKKGGSREDRKDEASRSSAEGMRQQDKAHQEMHVWTELSRAETAKTGNGTRKWN
jgi:hypothetical protein